MKILTDEEVVQCWSKNSRADDYEKYSLKEHVLRAARAIESAVLEKLKAQEAEKRLLNFSCQLCLDTGFLPKAAILPEPPDIKCPNGCRPNNRHLQPDVLKAQDKGPWKSGKNELDNRVFVQSDDFTHDVRLYIDGDFGGYEERLAYADGIADALNRSLPPDDVVRDAARYKWLRERNWIDSPLCVVTKPYEAVKLGYYCPSHDRLDAAIDAAMKEMK